MENNNFYIMNYFVHMIKYLRHTFPVLIFAGSRELSILFRFDRIMVGWVREFRAKRWQFHRTESARYQFKHIFTFITITTMSALHHCPCVCLDNAQKLQFSESFKYTFKNGCCMRSVLLIHSRPSQRRGRRRWPLPHWWPKKLNLRRLLTHCSRRGPRTLESVKIFNPKETLAGLWNGPSTSACRGKRLCFISDSRFLLLLTSSLKP